MFKTGQQAPAFMLHLRVQPLGDLLTSDAKVAEVTVQRLLVDRTQTTHNSAPCHEPVDLTLQLLWKCQARLIDMVCLLHANAVLLISKSRAHAVTKQVEPAHFVSRTQFSPSRYHKQFVAERSDCHERPGFSFLLRHRFQFPNEWSRISRSGVVRALLTEYTQNKIYRRF